jgi:uncharacterized protein
MANIDKHPVGSFCWIELSTSDQNAAKSFYTSLFGWNFNEFPMGPQEVYTIFRLHDRDVAAAYTLRPEERTQGVPPHWNLYVAVENADQSAAKAASLEGTVLAAAFDVMDVGRMAVVQDPTGAVILLWQAKKHSGVGITGVDGTLCWADLSTSNPARAQTFYGGLFGWTFEKGKNDDYIHIKNGEEYIGGIPPASHRNPNAPPHWLSYFYVSDVEASAAKAKQLGATLHLPPMKMENVGTMAVVADPQGAAFALFASARK